MSYIIVQLVNGVDYVCRLGHSGQYIMNRRYPSDLRELDPEVDVTLFHDRRNAFYAIKEFDITALPEMGIEEARVEKTDLIMPHGGEKR